jgi:hypothetical protein
MKHFRVGIGAALLLGIAACETDDNVGETTADTTADTTESPALTPRAYFDGYAQANCERTFRCAKATRHPSAEACVESYEAGAEPKRGRFEAAVADGSLAFSATTGQQCLDLLSGPCADDDLTRIQPVCNETLAGTLAVGAPCVAHAQCADGDGGSRHYCFAGCQGLFGGEAEAMNGTCLATSPVGSAACP